MAVLYCNRCGCENPERRGACLMCLNLLVWPAEGNACSSCGADNAAEALFCAACGAAMAQAAAGARHLDEAINLVLGEAAEDEGLREEGYVGDEEVAEPPTVPEVDFETAEPVEEAPPAPPEEPEPYEPVAPLAEEIEAPEAPPAPPTAEEPPAPPDEFAPEFEELAIELETVEEPESEGAPPPPPGAIELDETPADESDEDEDLGGWTIEATEDQESG